MPRVTCLPQTGMLFGDDAGHELLQVLIEGTSAPLDFLFQSFVFVQIDTYIMEMEYYKK